MPVEIGSAVQGSIDLSHTGSCWTGDNETRVVKVLQVIKNSCHPINTCRKRPVAPEDTGMDIRAKEEAS
jgi:hypothetical protein